MPAPRDSLSVLVKETVDGLGQLMGEHVRLFKLECAEDLNITLRQAARVAVVVGFAFVGYVFVWVGAVALLAPLLGVASAAFLVGGLHLAGGAIGLGLALRGLARTRLLDGTALEVHRTVRELTAASSGREVTRAH